MAEASVSSNARRIDSIASALAYNYFHIPPTGQFTIASSQHWVALIAFFAVAAAASAVADLARERATEAEQRREEADLVAEAARALLGVRRLDDAMRPLDPIDADNADPTPPLWKSVLSCNHEGRGNPAQSVPK